MEGLAILAAQNDGVLSVVVVIDGLGGVKAGSRNSMVFGNVKRHFRRHEDGIIAYERVI